MPPFLNTVKAQAQYAFVGAGVLWLVLALYEWSALLLWPVIALVAAGAMLRLLPGERLTWAWAVSAAVLGMVVALYQVYLALPLLQSAFSTVAGASLAVFAVFAAAHVVLAYAGASVKSA